MSDLMPLGRRTGESHYTFAAEKLIHGLIDDCLDFDHPDRPGLLLHGTVDYPRRSGVDESIIYGDHYFMEALAKLRRQGQAAYQVTPFLSTPLESNRNN